LQLTFGNYIAVDEAVRYTPHPNDSNKTLLTQEAVVTVRGVPLTNYMEDLLASKISFNANKVTLLLYYLIASTNVNRKLDKSDINATVISLALISRDYILVIAIISY
jgi:hypothetical protein